MPEITFDDGTTVFVPERVHCQAVVDPGPRAGVFIVRVTPLDLTKHCVKTFTIQAEDEDSAARQCIDSYVADQQGLERFAYNTVKSLPR